MVIIVIIMMLRDLIPFIEQQTDSIKAGVLSGVLVSVFSWLIHCFTRTRPCIGISKTICNDYEDKKYRIKIRNNGLSNVKVVSANFVLSYNPNTKAQGPKNDIPIVGKEDPLLFGLFNATIHKKSNLKTFDTFVLDAQLITDEAIRKKTSDHIREIYKSEERRLTIEDFFDEDETAIISAVFDVKNFRTGANRIFSYTYHKCDILEETCFNSGRSFKTHKKEGNKDSDVE